MISGHVTALPSASGDFMALLVAAVRGLSRSGSAALGWLSPMATSTWKKHSKLSGKMQKKNAF